MPFKTILGLVVVVLFVIAAVALISPRQPSQPAALAVLYSCDGGKSINATYYPGTGEPAAQPGQPPVPSGSVDLVLSDGRAVTLPQTISADGVRYANADESLVFWNKGNGALVLENNQEKSYIGCISVTPDPGGLARVYSSGSEGFSLRYPAGYAVDADYAYQALGPGKSISGVKFTIDPAMATGTNLSTDSYMSVESIPNTPQCSAAAFLGESAQAQTVADGDTTYSFASTTDAAAGNRYEESVYALPATNPCIAVRYFVHYGAIENYPAGAVRAFDRAALLQQFDAIRRTLTVQ